MKKLTIFSLVAVFTMAISMTAAAESGSPKGSPKGSPTKAMYSKDALCAAIVAYVNKHQKDTGSFNVTDDDAGKVRKFQFAECHTGSKQKGEVHTMCADFIEFDSGDVYDVDFDMKKIRGNLEVIDVRLHKLLKKGSGEGSPKGSPHNHDHGNHKGSPKGSPKGSY